MKQYDVAAVVWPAYHYEPRMERFWPEKDGEWYTVRRGTPRFQGHYMPRIPLLGYQDEADPAVNRQHVELARAHGINVFIMDWYWYDNAPCFERQLNEGLLPSLSGTDTRFYLMWANHDATTLWDMHTDEQKLLWPGGVSRQVLEPMFDRVIDRYLKHENYYCVGGKPVFAVFRRSNLIAGLGGLDQAKEALEWMRRRCIAKGLPGLHIQAMAYPGRGGPEQTASVNVGSEEHAAGVLGFDSATSYQFCASAFDEGDYVPWAANAMSHWDRFEKIYKVFHPHVSVGWDNTQRHPSAKAAVIGATPEAFEACLWKARHYLDARPDQAPLVTINSWNEWTEGSYLLPDMRWGYRYLQAVRNVFGNEPSE